MKHLLKSEERKKEKKERRSMPPLNPLSVDHVGVPIWRLCKPSTSVGLFFILKVFIGVSYSSSVLLVATIHDPVLDMLRHVEDAMGSNVVGSSTPMASRSVGSLAPLESLVIRRRKWI